MSPRSLQVLWAKPALSTRQSISGNHGDRIGSVPACHYRDSFINCISRYRIVYFLQKSVNQYKISSHLLTYSKLYNYSCLLAIAISWVKKKILLLKSCL